MEAKLRELLKPENLFMAAAFIGAYAGLHATPAAPFLAIVDVYMLGDGAADMGNALWQLYLDLDSATTEKELDEASKGLSKQLSGPVADALVKALLLGGGKAAATFNKRYKVEIDQDALRRIGNGSTPNSGVPLPPVKITRRNAPNRVPKLSSNAKDLLNGSDVRVGSIREADALLKEAFPNARKVTGTGPGQSGPPDWTKFKGKGPDGIFHKDYHFDPKTGRIYGHGAGNPHGGFKHINIKLPDGRKVTIIIEPN